MLDLAAIRADTPGVQHRVHLNNAGAALMPTPVLDAMRAHLELEGRIGGYEAADLRAEAVQGVYEAVAILLASSPGQVALMEHATAAFVAALSTIPFRRGDVLLTTRHDYVSNQIQYLSLERRMGVEVVRAPDLPEGGVDVQAVSELVHRRRPRLVAVTQRAHQLRTGAGRGGHRARVPGAQRPLPGGRLPVRGPDARPGGRDGL